MKHIGGNGELDQKILEAALSLEAGEGLSREALLGRFPRHEEQVEKALEALQSYQRLVRDDRGRRSVGTADDLLSAGVTLGEYTITGPLGRGNMGVVYRARQASPGGREVALKLLPTDLAARDSRFAERFRREAGLASRLHHPNLAEVYGVGAEGEQLYIAMRLVEGRTLADVLSGLVLHHQLGAADLMRSDFARQVVRVVRDIASALSTIHAAGLVHRDVKPANVILEGAGEDDLAALQGRPVLVDFGLLRSADASELTGTQTLLGTPAFAAPEAQLGRAVDARTDVFSLGVVLYDLLTLTPPGRRHMASSGLPDVVALNPAVDRRLAAIVSRATEDRSGLRYADGGAFERELERYLSGKSIRALPANPVGRIWLLARRRPARAAWVGSTLSVILVVLVVLAGGEVVRAVRLRSSIRAAVELEQNGQLHRAWQSWSTLPSRAGILDAFFETDEDLARSEDFWGGEFGKVCSQLGTVAGDGLQQGHARLREFMLTLGNDEHLEAALRFLVHEIEEGDPQRVRSAAETATIYLMIFPQAFGVPLPNAELDARFEDALRELASHGGNGTLSREARYYAVAAMSGLPRSSTFEALLPLVDDDDLELNRLATAALLRQCWLAWEDRREKEFPPKLLDEWLLVLAKTSQQREKSVRLAPTFQDSIHAVVDTYGAGGGSTTGVLGQDYPEFNAYIERVVQAHAEVDQGLDPFILPWIDLWAKKRPVHLRKVRTGTTGRASVYETYKNLWMPCMAEVDEIRGLSVDPNAQVFSFSLLEDCGPAYEASPGHSSMERVRWRGAELTSPERTREAGRLEFDNPFGRSEITLTCPIPQPAKAATVTIKHEAAARYFLPYRGGARFEVRVQDSEPVLGGSVHFEVQDHRFTIDRQVLAQSKELALSIRFVSGTSAYWLRGVVVDFR